MSYQGQMAFRTSEDDKRLFDRKCEEAGRTPSDMLREMVEAFNQGRMSITRKPENDKLGIYK